MLISLLIFLLVSNAVALRRDKSTLFSRVAIKTLIFASFIAINQEFTSFKPENITLNSGLSGAISIMTLLLVLFIFIPGEWFNIVSILARNIWVT